jgi:Ca2+-binding RTX toxin-like protein
VDRLTDKITEKAGEGVDKVLTTLSTYTLGTNLENLQFDAGVVAAVGTGNALDNAITAFGGNDTLDGAAGNDQIQGFGGTDKLLGGTGDDVLDGGAGADALSGGAGNDSYAVDDAGDVVTEAANQGIDTVTSTISFDLSASSNVENLILSGAGSLTGGGNDLNNTIQGNAGISILSGDKGEDTLLGNNGADVLSGGEGNDVLEGGLGADAMTGGDGNDLFLYRIADPSELATLGGDTITNFESGKDKINLMDLVFEFNIFSSNPFTEGFLKLDIVGADTVVKFDSDGGGDNFVTLVTVQNAAVTASDLVF